jgi:hypothetical protein
LEWESSKGGEDKFWIPVRRMEENEKTKEMEVKFGGKIQCSLRIYPKELADKFDQGEGRDAPNNDPLMPEPVGRIKLSLNPFEMFNQLVGPAVRRKIYCALCCLACTALCVAMAPMVISNGFSKIVFG